MLAGDASGLAAGPRHILEVTNSPQTTRLGASAELDRPEMAQASTSKAQQRQPKAFSQVRASLAD
jgi:hypothetical protein